MLGLLINRLPDDALMRIADPTALWTTGTPLGDRGARCLAGHAGDYYEGAMGFPFARDEAAINQVVAAWAPFQRSVGDMFDKLSSRFTLARVSRACRLRAERVLASRGLVPHERVPDRERALVGARTTKEGA